MQLRPYQQAAVDAVYQHLRTREDNPCVVLPTGSGKTPVLATICRDAAVQWDGRALVLAHVKELLEQSVGKLRALCQDLSVGVYSAGLRRRDTSHRVIVAGIQSVYKRACDLDAFDLVLVDEAHMIPPEGEGMYLKFLSDAKKVNPRLRIVGLTATPYRLRSGMICGPDRILNHVCYEIGVRELIVQGFLSPLVTKAGRQRPDMSKLRVRGGEFVADEVEALMDQDELVQGACDEIVDQTQDRQAVLIFASGVKHGRSIVRTLAKRHGIDCGFVCGETPAGERAELLDRFRGRTSGLFAAQPLKYLCNVNVLAIGFDAPQVDCVALVRPTASPGLYCQQVGRGFRLHPGKRDCLVLDFGGNVLRHGPVDQINVREQNTQGAGQAPAKECPDCHSVVAAGCSVCPDCGHEFPPPERTAHEAQATTVGILAGQVSDEVYEVRDETYRVHHKRGADEDAPRTLRVDYQVGLDRWQSEFICFEHNGWARARAEVWWRARSTCPVPETAEEALQLAQEGALRGTRTITVRNVAGEKYDRIVGYELDEEPRAALAGLAEDEIPF